MGKLSKIKALLQSIVLDFNNISTDKGLLRYDGEELQEGLSVMLVDEDNNESIPEDGVYQNESYILTISDGKIEKVEEKEIEQEPEDEPEEAVDAKAEFTKKKQQYEESYNEKTIKIADAIRSLGFDAWVIEAGDDFAVAELWIEETMDYKYYRFSISWDEEGNAIASDPIEVKSAFVPVEENVPEVSEEVEKEEEFAEEEPEAPSLEDRIADLESKLADALDRIAKLEGEPAAESAEEEFKKQNKPEKEDKYAKLERIMKLK